MDAKDDAKMATLGGNTDLFMLMSLSYQGYKRKRAFYLIYPMFCTTHLTLGNNLVVWPYFTLYAIVMSTPCME